MRLYRALALLPVASVLVGPFFLNRVTPFLLGMPFLLGWLSLTLVATSLVMWIIFRFDHKRADNSNDSDSNGDKV